MEPDQPRAYDVFQAGCPSRQAFDHVFSRWGILILVKLSGGPTRFGTLYRAIDGISERMLSQTLKALEEEGLVNRQEWDEKPPRVEYTLTEAGRQVSGGMARVIGDFYGVLGRRAPAPTAP